MNYGFGYTGSGFFGGQWQGGQYYYNSSVSNVKNVNVTNVYNKQVTINNTTNVSYNGGTGGTAAKPLPRSLRPRRSPTLPRQLSRFTTLTWRRSTRRIAFRTIMASR